MIQNIELSWANLAYTAAELNKKLGLEPLINLNLSVNKLANKLREAVKLMSYPEVEEFTKLTRQVLCVLSEEYKALERKNDAEREMDERNGLYRLRAFSEEDAQKLKKMYEMKTLTVTDEAVKRAAEKCPTAKQVLTELFPEVFPPEPLLFEYDDFYEFIVNMAVIPTELYNKIPGKNQKEKTQTLIKLLMNTYLPDRKFNIIF